MGDEHRPEPVTVTVARRAPPAREGEFEEWSEKHTSAASRFPGFLGAGLLRPGHVGEPWHVVFRFACAEDLRAREGSPERARLLAAGEELVHATDQHRVTGLGHRADDLGRDATRGPPVAGLVLRPGPPPLTVRTTDRSKRGITAWPAS